MNEKYNVIIVDDEYLARKLLQDYVSKVESVQLVATCSTAFEAMEALTNNTVDIMLLDIQMPDLTGLELVKSLEKKPETSSFKYLGTSLMLLGLGTRYLSFTEVSAMLRMGGFLSRVYLGILYIKSGDKSISCGWHPGGD